MDSLASTAINQSIFSMQTTCLPFFSAKFWRLHKNLSDYRTNGLHWTPNPNTSLFSVSL